MTNQESFQSVEDACSWLVAKISKAVKVSPHEIDVMEPFGRLGLSSIEAVAISGELADYTGKSLLPSLLYDYPTIYELAQYLMAQNGDLSSGEGGPGKTSRATPVAVIGISCRFPGADDPQAFWRMLTNGESGIRKTPPERWDLDELYACESTTKEATQWGGFVDGIDLFDPQFFRISPREAAQMDPQQRLLMEVAWEGLENSGQRPGSLKGSNTGVFVGISSNDYSRVLQNGRLSVDAHTGTGCALSIAANRLSYFLDLKGPSMAIDTACSSSLVAVHQACSSLELGECDLALAGGVNLILGPELSLIFARASMLSKHGTCRTFDESADGYVRSEGAGMVVLKRLSDAQESGDDILAVIRGSAVNQNGKSNTLTAPNGKSQERVIRAALRRAGVTPAEISYLETHGTGTALGDPIEVNALKSVFMKGRTWEPLYLGAVKSNIGHLEAAAGVAGLVKTILALKECEIPQNLHFEKLNPKIDLDGTPLTMASERMKWVRTTGRRMAGVSSFGFGGTNAHVVLEEAPQKNNSDPGIHERPLHVLKLAARSTAGLRLMAERFLASMTVCKPEQFSDFCFSANAGREEFPHRLMIAANGLESGRRKLSVFLEGNETTDYYHATVTRRRPPGIGFLFTGQGSQYSGMGQELYKSSPVFAAAVASCSQILDHLMEERLEDLLFNSAKSHLLESTTWCQPALFALEYALAQLLYSWGVKADVLLGHSIGEFVAAALAGVFSLEDALKLVATRGRLMGGLTEAGGMLVVFAPEADVVSAISRYSGKVDLGAVNGPNHCVISGKKEAIASLAAEWVGKGTKVKLLKVSGAFHSRLMEPVVNDFRTVASEISYSKPSIPIVSNSTGQIVGEEIAGADYWCDQLLSTVQFMKGITTLAQQVDWMVELGPSPTLLSMGQRCVPALEKLWVPTLRPHRTDWQSMTDTLGLLYVNGLDIDWKGFDKGYSRKRILAPNYPFEKRRHWKENHGHATHHSSERITTPTAAHSLLGPRLRSPALDKQKVSVFSGNLSPDRPAFLNDHQVFGIPVLPASAYIDMALCGANELLNKEAICVSSILFRKAMTLRGSTQVQAVFTPEGFERYHFEIYSLDSPEENGIWTLHASGSISPLVETRASSIDLQKTGNGTQTRIDSATLYRQYDERGMHYGPAFQAVKSIAINGQSVLGNIHISEASRAAGEKFLFHPILLDAGMQIIAAPVAELDKENPFLPIAIDSVELYRTVQDDHLRSLAKLSELPEAGHNILKGDFEFFSDAAELVARVKGLTLRRVQRSAAISGFGSVEKSLAYELTWKPVSPSRRLSLDKAVREKDWLIFADQTGVGETLARIIHRLGGKASLVYDGPERRQREDGNWDVRLGEAKDYLNLFRGRSEMLNSRELNIVHCWNLDLEGDVNHFHPAVSGACYSLIHTVNALRALNIRNPSLTVLTRGGVSATRAEASLSPLQALAWGVAKVIAMEEPELATRVIDLDPGVEPEIGDVLLQDLLNSREEDLLAIRGGTRMGARLVSKELERRNHPDGWRGKSYLITGGIGSLGLEVARWLADRGAKHLVLTARRAPSEAAKAEISEIESRGTAVAVRQADVIDRERMEEIFQEMKTEFRPLGGIFHLAGLIALDELSVMDPETFEAVLGPKLQGTWNLHQISKSEPMDHFICFSSIASVWGSKGQAHYAAANSFQDCLMWYRQANGLPGTSLNWGPWAGGGMANQAPQDHLGKMGIGALSAERAIEAMELALDDGSCQTVLADVDWPRFKALYSARHKRPLFALIEAKSSPRKVTQQKRTEFLARLREASPADRELQLTTYLREIASTLLGVQLHERDNGLQFTQLGLDSLIAMELSGTIEAQLGIKVDVALFLQDIDLPSCAAALSKLLDEQLTDTKVAPVGRHEDRNTWREMVNGQRAITPARAKELLASVDQLSEQDVIGLLASLTPDHESVRTE
jgi:acyl transferase domain-containing protein/acyl carrier protein